MKKIALLFMFAALAFASQAQKGHYKGGKGSSHKDGKYKNPSTGNHYKKH